MLLIPLSNLNIKNDFKLSQKTMIDQDLEIIYFGAGCFWCVEAIFQEVDGVVDVIPGYCGGATKNPTYNDVCSGNTGHVEVAKITFDSKKVQLDHLLDVFWKTHDPTTLNRQGNDIGTQYRSAIFYLTENQKSTANKFKEQLEESRVWENTVVTEILKIDIFYPAENSIIIITKTINLKVIVSMLYNLKSKSIKKYLQLKRTINKLNFTTLF